jgi:glycosyltransferase involved in cell wall biosynthesis
MRQCHVLTVASRTLETLALGHGISAEKIIYLPNGPGIDTPEPGTTTPSTSDQPTILLYTRFFEFDVARLVAVLDGVHAQLPELRVLLVGASLQAEDGARFRHLMAQRDLLTTVEETGWLAEEALPAVLQSADVGLYLMDDTLLNRAKCPVKLADMAALGLPVVGEAVGQVPEYVIHEKTGLLQPTGAVPELVDNVVRLLRNADERAQFGAAAQAHIQSRFAWAQLAQSAEAAYQSK